MRLMILTFSAVLSAVPLQTRAQSVFCGSPEPPFCLTSADTFQGQIAFDKCGREMDLYWTEVDQFIACMRQATMDEAGQYDRALDYWNCRAKGGVSCGPVY